jgi:hypothetical protein
VARDKDESRACCEREAKIFSSARRALLRAPAQRARVDLRLHHCILFDVRALASASRGTQTARRKNVPRDKKPLTRIFPITKLAHEKGGDQAPWQ